MKTKIFISIVLISCLFTACQKGSGDSIINSKKSGFNSPDEFLENPSIKNAIVESDIPIYQGTNPPVLSGIYTAAGSVIDVSANASELYGSPINSLITLYNQTASGKINFKEEVSGVTVYGAGGYIIGKNGEFSIFQESLQSGEEAGLPSDLTVTVVLIMSGSKYSQGNSQGDLRAKGISIVTKATSTNPKNYDLKEIEKIWWMWDAYFNLEGPAKKFSSINQSSLCIPGNITEIIRSFKLN
jgi:hypothetical protein